MNNFKKRLLLAAVIAVFAVIGFLMNSQQAVAQDPGGGPTVTINPTQLPLPVKGSVTGTVTGTVDLASGASVHVNNTVADPVRVRNVNDAIQPFHAAGHCISPTGLSGGFCTVHLYSVPGGKRAVIEYFSGDALLDAGQPLTLVGFTTALGGVQLPYNIPTTPPALQLSQGTAATSWGQMVRAYADSSAPIIGSANYPVGGAASVNFSISGYLVDVPFTP